MRGAKRRLAQAVQPPEVFHHFIRRQPPIERGRRGKKSNAGPHFIRLGHDVEAVDGGAAHTGAQQGGEHAQTSGFAGAVTTQQPEDFSRVAMEIDMIDRHDLAAFPVTEKPWSIAGLGSWRVLEAVANVAKGLEFRGP